MYSDRDLSRQSTKTESRPRTPNRASARAIFLVLSEQVSLDLSLNWNLELVNNVIRQSRNSLKRREIRIIDKLWSWGTLKKTKRVHWLHCSRSTKEKSWRSINRVELITWMNIQILFELNIEIWILVLVIDFLIF